MSERDYAPLSIACVRGLCDKLYEKRKFAGVEIEKMVKDFSDANNTSQIKRLIRVLGQDLMASTNPNVKNGALMGLSSVAVGLGKGCIAYLPELVHPIVACFSEGESRVRYQAAEALFNVVKVARGAVLAHFPLVFDALARLAADPEPQVKQGAELLDRLVKEIVTESEEFSLEAFVPMLRERMYSRNAAARQFCVSWLGVLDSAPELPLARHLPELLDALLCMLDDPHPEIRRMCEIQLGEFLRGVKKEPARADFAAMINILITHAQSPEELLQLTAITWIKEFVELAGAAMLPFASGVLAAALPALAYSDEPRRSIREIAAIVNLQLQKLVVAESPSPSPAPPEKGERDASSDHKTGQTESGDQQGGEGEGDASSDHKTGQTESGGEGDASNDHKTGQTESGGEGGINLDAVVGVLTQMLSHGSVHTKVAVLDWILHLYNKLPQQMSAQSGKVFVSAVGSLTDPADDVVRRSLAVAAELCTCPGAPGEPEASPYYRRFLRALLRLLAADGNLLEDRGAFIIRQLCVLLNAEDIYKALSSILGEERNLAFAATAVRVLGGILLTAAELHHLRLQLRAFSAPATRQLFAGLYRCWCHSPVSLLALCLLTHNYQHCNALISTFGELEITVDFLTELDKLVQLIESPIFAYMRLELLGGAWSAELRGALYGLLMLLPQSEAFHTLRRRLQCAPPAHLPSLAIEKPATDGGDIDFAALLGEFRRVQDAHRRYKLGERPRARASHDYS